MAYQDFLIDKRIVQRHIEKGLVDAKQLEKLISSLPDRADNAAATTLESQAEQPAPDGAGGGDQG
jgi:hypothetical protein